MTNSLLQSSKDECQTAFIEQTPANSALLSNLQNVNGPIVQTCMSAGLWDAGASILLDNIVTQVWYLTNEYTYGIVNQAHAAFYGAEKEAFAFQNMYDIFPKEHVDERRKTNAAVFATGIPTSNEEWVTNGLGERRRLHIHKSPVLRASGTVEYVVCSAEDITEAELYKKQLEYLSLHDKMTGLYNRVYLEDALTRLEDDAQYPISIIIGDVDGLKLINDSLGHDRGDEMIIICANILKQSARAGDILARVGGDEFSLILPRTHTDQAEEILRQIQAGTQIFNYSHKTLHVSLSLGGATTVDKSVSLHETFIKADDRMYRCKLNKGNTPKTRIINTLMAALGERDYMKDGHGERLTELCRRTGELVGLPSGQIDNLDLLCTVHDLGKAGIPDRILFKKGKLTAEEWDIMNKHPEIGYRIAASSPDLSTVGDLILKHHERWDGTGYPLGIANDEIPIECRIIAIADAFDSISNDRPYAKARSKDEAIAEIKKNAGTQFDPHVAKLFIEKVLGESLCE